MKKHVLIALAIGLVAGLLSYQWQVLTECSDLYQRLCTAAGWLDGAKPYAACPVYYRGQPATEYPLTTILAFVPLARLPFFAGSAIFWGISNALLAFGILHNGRPHYWLIFASGPYWMTFSLQQFSVIVTAALFLPALLPLALLKPQIGLPVILTNPNRRGLTACAAYLALTLVLAPTWPLDWLAQAGNYDGLIPLLVLPFGPLLFLTLFHWREKWGRFLFLFACMPQRLIHDLTPLLILPATLRQMLVICILSWIPASVTIMGLNPYPEDEIRWTLPFVYLPLLIMQFIPEIKRFLANRRRPTFSEQSTD